jgi:hypothetical protein
MLATVHAAAQADFAGLDLKAGDIVYVTESSGTKVTGRLSSVSPALLVVDKYVFKPAPGLRIERRGDRIWDGAAIGVAAGVGLGALTAAGECGIDRGGWRCTLAGAGWLGLIGTLIDWRHVGRTEVYVGGSSGAPPPPGIPPRPSQPAGVGSIRFRIEL